MTRVGESAERRRLLRRHRLVHLKQHGWHLARDAAWDDEAAQCLHHWMARDFPLVITRQPSGLPASHVALGLPTPLEWGRRRLSVTLPAEHIAWFEEFPRAEHVAAQLSRKRRPVLRRLAAELTRRGIHPHVYGSHGWQAMTGMPYVRPGSDIDLWLSVAGVEQSDQAVRLLSAFEGDPEAPCIDGELVSMDGEAVAWREWRQWRAGSTRRVLVKRLNGVALSAMPLAGSSRVETFDLEVAA